MPESQPFDDVLGALRERAKELSCLYRVDAILSSDAPSGEVFRRVVETLPKGWQYPEITQPYLEIHDQVYKPTRFRETPWVQRARIRAGRTQIGELRIYYTEERPEEDEGPFLNEEYQLLRAMAERIGDYVLRTQGAEPQPATEAGEGRWRVILDFLRRTDPRLLQWITRKMLNHLRWRGVEAAEHLVPLSARRPDVDPGDENRPLTRTPTSALRPGTDDVFEIAGEHLPDREILSHIQMWISQDKISFLVHALEDPGTSLQETIEALERFQAIGVSEAELPHSTQTMLRVALLRRFFTDQIGFINTAKAVVSVNDFYELSRRVLAPRGSHGRLGGKSAGMFLAWQVVRNSPEYGDVLQDIRVPQTWYVASDAVLAFVRYNGLDEIYDMKYQEIDQVRQQYPHVVQVFKSAEFPPELEKGLAAVLDDLGDVPLIVRSSSLLEDRTGSAFSGKYKSLFLANQGTKRERLQALKDAVAEVYASIFGPDALEYRAERNLLDVHEEMGLMIQEVVGQRVGPYWLPAFSGVALSTNEFRWSPRIRREDGLLRLVPGLGTRAVDRLSDDYPVLLAPGQPGLRVNATPEERMRYTPRSVDVINLETNEFETISAEKLLREHGNDLPLLKRMVSIVEDGHLRSPRALGEHFDEVDALFTFEGLAGDSPFIGQAATLLDILEGELGMPVDVEFAADGGHMYLLQCRSQSYSSSITPAAIPVDIPEDRIVFSATHHISNGYIPELTHVVYVVPERYAELPERDDLRAVSRAVGRLNTMLPRRQFMLMGPGRWGSRGDIHLGVPVTYADINNTVLLCEVARQKGSYVPDLSFGTHFFQDLVEAEIRYLPLYPDEPDTLFNEEFLLGSPNELAELLPDFAHLADTIRVIHVPEATDGRILRVVMNGEDNEALGYLTDPGRNG